MVPDRVARNILERAQAQAHLGAWQVDVETSATWWSDEVYRIFGHDPATFDLTLDSAMDQVDPRNRPMVDEIMARLARGEAVETFEYRQKRPDGEVRWLEAHAELVEGRYLVGFMQDITERHARADQLRLQGQILDTMREGVALVRPSDRRVLYVTPTAAAQLRLPMDELIGRPVSDFVAPGQ